MPRELTTPASPQSGSAPTATIGGPAPGVTSPVAPPLGPPRDPAGAGAAPGGRRFRPAAVVVALLVLLTGAAVGAGMFALEQNAATWRPHATRTATGWRIAGPNDLAFHHAALSGDHLVWICGPYTVVFDLGSGKSRLLGIARRAGGGAAPAVSGQYAVWLDETPGGLASPSIWSYRFATSERRRLPDTPGIVSAPALSGETVVWARRTGGGASAGTSTTIVARDLAGGAQRVVTAGPAVGDPIVADGTRVGWSETLGAAGSPSAYYDVKDIIGGQTYRVDLLAGMASADLTDIDLSGNVLVWRLRASDGSGEILARDLSGGTTLPVTSGPGLTGGSVDGDVVAWSQPAGGGTSIMARRLSGGAPFVVAAVAHGAVRDVLVSGGTVAWIVDGGQGAFNGIETARLGQ